MERGYWGIGLFEPKTKDNLGTLWRSAQNFGADFIFTIGERYKKQRTDTTFAERHIPLYNYKTWEDFISHIPSGCQVVCIEQTDGAKDIKNSCHPERAIYVLGAEDYGIPDELMRGYQKVFINTPMCLNVAVAGSIVMYDRSIK
ncbi:MAG: RNA methyltransferase [Patescibacteria group bacterium]|nr:RNA methyltransferase [Patescibacteria group bacterium]